MWWLAIMSQALHFEAFSPVELPQNLRAAMRSIKGL